MGIIKAALNAIGGGLADSWLEVIEPAPMSDTTCFAPGQVVSQNGKSQNTKGTAHTVSNGSIIHVMDNQFMMLIDGGKVVDYTAEPGYYKVDNSSMPSLFNGQFGESLKETFNRVKFGGITPQSQKVFYINLQELKGIKFGTVNPVNYFDTFYNSELFLRAHGTYSIKISEPLKFYAEAIPKDAVTSERTVNINDINRQYTEEFLQALTSSINQMSADGVRISFVSSQTQKLSKYMAEALDEEWNAVRGMEIKSVGIASISYDDKSKDLINMRNKGAMLSDDAVQKGYVAANLAEGIKDAGSNGNGSMAGFMGVGMGMNMGGNILGGYGSNLQAKQPEPPAPQPQAPAQPAQPAPAPSAGADSWTCTCGAVNTGKFCPECGAKKPEAPSKKFCTNCGTEVKEGSKFCPECGTKLS